MKTVAQLLALKTQQDVYTIAPDAWVLDALRLMAEKNVGALPVMRDGELVGIVSERDYARKVALQGRASYATPVSEIMTEAVIIVLPQQTVGDCMQMMTDHHLRHLPVMGNGKLIGLLSIGDLVKATTVQQAELIRHLEGYIRGE
ncbi:MULTISPECIES: CBS domain-containing protein [Pseudomonadaceae]|jgi:CBS domain-containing protein|uniref:CBS domain-containing protein n=3 Tax=Pseudomonadaceae TaxID=135621 RepID=A0A1G5MM21_9PSED|nr:MULTISPECIES: CBS domain-containing protein [Pseudomonas]MBH3328999.1 CBS domain-containing protein [Pseudomonas oryzihabitans]MDU4056077.1 CBS domain-containing protein [Pseudomonas oryzihabitans]NMY88175.1 CBS domain-containing protein [Pseudomonas psychrotolerans]NMZ45196.1 CBS domain-containing protein [Pseudomonas oryzihabitans]RED02792.1 CBS domain protein [Pseudomonas oleovorans]